MKKTICGYLESTLDILKKLWIFVIESTSELNMCGGTPKTSNSAGSQTQNTRKIPGSSGALVSSFSKPRLKKAKKLRLVENGTKCLNQATEELSNRYESFISKKFHSKYPLDALG